MSKDFENIQKLYSDLKTIWEQKRPDWEDISHFVGITLDTNYIYNKGSDSDNARSLDEYVDDPTSAISVNQAGDYLMGVMWGTGEKVFDIIPSRYVTELVDEKTVEDWYGFATDQALYHINHEDAGFTTALRPYTYDQFSFGTSGIGCFLNKNFLSSIEENALVFRDYGVDNTMLDEGKSGQPEIVFCAYNWKVNRIIAEFVKENGVFDEKKFGKLPKPIREAYKASNYNDRFQIIFGFFPREDYNPKLKGKKGTRYRGVWFLDDQNNGEPFYEEDFRDRPIAMARAIKVRGETYGRASGTLLISTIRSVNFMVGTAIEIVEKMSQPPLGITSNALFGDSVLDTSADGLTVFNNALSDGKGNPVFPLVDVGDPSAILSFLVPYLNEKIVTAFKVDSLLDFSSAKEMTATESLQRYAIRGKSLAGFLLQQKNEALVPITKRSINLLMAIGELGIHPTTDAEKAAQLITDNRGERVIPEAVAQVMEDGKPWFELKFNNELEKLVRTENVQALLQMIQAITAVAALNPKISMAIDWYKLLRDINDNLDYNSQIMLSPDEFQENIEAAAEMERQALALQASQATAEVQKTAAQANKTNRDAERSE